MCKPILRMLQKMKDRLRTREQSTTRKGIETLQIQSIYKTRPYMEAYREHTNMRVAKDPHSAVGGMWDQIGELQFDFMTANGLKPDNSLLDVGCGTLRGGRFFIRFLEPKRYSGFDLSPTAIKYAKRLIHDEGLEEKQPRLLVNCNRDLRFREFTGEFFDFILAQSVFTHLPREHIEECFESIGHIMTDKSRFFFTYNEAGQVEQRTLKDFSHPLSFFIDLADKNGFMLEDCSHHYNHPRRQKMVQLTRKARR